MFRFLLFFSPSNRPFITNYGLSIAKNGIGMNGYNHYLPMQSSEKRQEAEKRQEVKKKSRSEKRKSEKEKAAILPCRVHFCFIFVDNDIVFDGADRAERD